MSGFHRRPRRFAWLLGVAATVGLVVTAGPVQADPPLPAPPLDPTAAVAQVGPAVVNIDTQMGYARAVSAGTGIVIDPSGLVLTNNHVVAGATQITATSVGTQQSYDVDVLGYDRTHDVALLRLRGGSGLPVADLGDSNSVNVGDPVIAMGNAGGQGGTPSAVRGSIVSLNETVTASDDLTGASETLTGMLRAGTPLRPGDSGGPMVDATGRVIGVNTAASENYRMAQPGGEGFAIPINQALAIADQIRSGNASDTVHIGATPFLGIGVVDYNGTGARIVQVLDNTPAEQAGLKRGDILLGLGGEPIDSATALTRAIDRHHPGDTVELRWRTATGADRSATLTLAVGPVG